MGLLLLHFVKSEWLLASLDQGRVGVQIGNSFTTKLHPLSAG